jgi:hypothetical protein
MRLISVHDIALDVCSQIGDESAKNLHRVMRMGARAAEQLNLRFNVQVRTEMFRLSESNTITLPAKALKPIKTGKVVNGKLDLFDLTGSLFTESQIEGCVCEETVNYDILCPVHTMNNCCSGHSIYGSFMGTGSRLYIGCARWKPENNTIYYDSAGLDVGEYLLVEYQLEGDEQACMIPSALREGMIQRILMWFNQESNPRASMLNERRFVIELNEAKRTMETWTYDDLVKALRGTYSPRTYRRPKAQPTQVINKVYEYVDPTSTTTPGPFYDDSEALANGVLPGQQYYVGENNYWSLPPNVVRILGA